MPTVAFAAMRWADAAVATIEVSPYVRLGNAGTVDGRLAICAATCAGQTTSELCPAPERS